MIDHLTPDAWAVVNRALVGRRWRNSSTSAFSNRLLSTTVMRWAAIASPLGGIR